MKKIRVFGAIFIIIFSISACTQSSEKVSEAEETNIDSEFTLAKPEAVGLNSVIINELIDSIQTGYYPNRHSLLIYKDKQLVVEEYFTGKDENWGDDLGIVTYNDSLLHDLRSVSKSVVSACIGIAIAQGKIKSVDQPIFDFFEDYQQFNSEGREELTIKHLLTMTSGLKWNEEISYDNPENSEIQMIESGDAIGFVLSREIVDKPGTVWKYNGGTTELLAEIIHRVSDKNVHEFAKEFLFLPIGISNSEWTISPATNSPAAASGLRLTPRAMLKFGMLYLQDGIWDGKQIIPKEWVKESFEPHIMRPDGQGYGYQFWILDYQIDGKTLHVPVAVGNGDQRIFFDLQNKMLLITTAGNYNQWDIENDASALLKKIYSSFTLNN
ncbi:serine hydrolase [uncultured Algoriphagus sp.]|uniref:serine hydrolase domain-containing protein n=1 Tax=uncultured Algoriphagus sp. TaxID=417365 RepID=UPI0030EB6C42|tara:strand:+ start:52140 stop:53288 length:1149 start_codon:yes stop_codon:yes gene_type:complete